MLRRRIDLLRRFHLRRCQAGCIVRAGALQDFRVELALTRIFDEPVLYAVGRIAGIEHGLMDRLIFLGGNVAGLILQYRKGDPQ